MGHKYVGIILLDQQQYVTKAMSAALFFSINHWIENTARMRARNLYAVKDY